MAAIEATETEIQEAIEGREQELSIAAINGPTSTVISGTEDSVEEIRTRFEEQGAKTKRLDVSHAFHSPLIEPILGEFAEVIESLEPSEPKLSVISNLTGEPLTPEQATDPAYWVRHAREPVRFADSLAALKAQGATAYLELGPDPVLLAMAPECLGEEDSSVFLPTLREGREEKGTVTKAIASAHAAGAKVDWAAFFAGTNAKRVSLPTYPFQRKRFWLPATSVTADLGAAGLGDAEHPMLAAALEDPTGDGVILSGRLSLAGQPWLADHVVGEMVVVPGTALLELAFRAAVQTGAGSIEELTLESPLLLPARGAATIQVVVSSVEDGRRELAIHARIEGEEGGWTRSANGVLSVEPAPAPEPLRSWPPEDGRVCTESSLPEDRIEEAPRFSVHPALLDAALQAAGLLTEDSVEIEQTVSWRGVSLYGSGVSTLRLALASVDSGHRLEAFDAEGMPLFGIEAVGIEPLELAELRAAQSRRALHELAWQAAELPEPEAEPRTQSIEIAPAEGEIPACAQATAEHALTLLQQWAADEDREAKRLALITTKAVAAGKEDSLNLGAAPVWGLVRSAASEHPGRFAAIDTDGSEASEQALPAALALSATEPQIALRKGKALVPRLVKASGEAKSEPKPFDPEATLLISGGTSGLGALVARHLAKQGKAGHLLLVSRRGGQAPGAKELAAELKELGADTTIAACDVTDKGALGELIDSLPSEHPLGAVIHSAGAIDDGVLESMDPERLRRTMAPKATAAWNLHELTEAKELSHFVLFSSAAGILGGAAQANYAAANNFLDALAAYRRAQGLPATSLAWGLWDQASGLAGADAAELGEEVLERFANQVRKRLGFARMSPEQGLGLFDAALGADAALLAPVHFDPAALRERAEAGTLAPVLGGLVRARAGQRSERGSLTRLLAGVSASEQRDVVLELVRANTAAVLGYASAQEVEPSRAFQEMGFDSLAAVELRNRLGAATGLELSATVVFDYPSAVALAEHLLGAVSGDGNGAVAAESKEAEIRAAIASIPLSRLRSSGLIDSLLRLAEGGEEEGLEADEGDRIDSMDIEDLIRKSGEGLSLDPQGEDAP